MIIGDIKNHINNSIINNTIIDANLDARIESYLALLPQEIERYIYKILEKNAAASTIQKCWRNIYSKKYSL